MALALACPLFKVACPADFCSGGCLKLLSPSLNRVSARLSPWSWRGAFLFPSAVIWKQYAFGAPRKALLPTRRRAWDFAVAHRNSHHHLRGSLG